MTDGSKPPTAGRLVKNMTWLGAGNLLVKPIWFVFVTAVCVQILGVREYGIMVACLALSGIVGSFLDLGTSQYSIREIARERSRADLFFSNLLSLRLASGLLGLVLVIACGQLLGYDSYQLVALAFAAGYWLAQYVTEYCRTYYRAFERFDFEALSVILEKVVVVAIGMAFLVAGKNASWVLAGMFAGMSLVGLANAFWVSRRIARFRLSLVSASFLRDVVPKALPLGIASVFVMIYFRTDTVMVESIIGETAAGQYGLAYRILEALILLPSVIVAVLLPRLSVQFSQKERQDFGKLVRVGGSVLVLVGLVVAAIVTITAGGIISLLDPAPASLPAAGALRILVWTFPFAALNYLLSTAMTAANNEKTLAWVLGFAALLNVVLNLILIPEYSLYGAAAATITTEAVILIILTIRFLRDERPDSIAAETNLKR